MYWESLYPKKISVPTDSLATLSEQSKANSQEGQTSTKRWSYIVKRHATSTSIPCASRKWQCREVWLCFSTINLVERGLVTGKAHIYSTGALLAKSVLGVFYLSFFLQAESRSWWPVRTLENQLRVVLKARRRTFQIGPPSSSGFAYVSHLAEVRWLAQCSNGCHSNLATTPLLNIFPDVLNCHSASVWIRKTIIDHPPALIECWGECSPGSK